MIESLVLGAFTIWSSVKLINKWDKVLKLKYIVDREYPDKIFFMKWFIMSKIIAETSFKPLLEKLQHTIVKKGKIYEISYIIEGREYKLLVKKKRGPHIIRNIVEEGTNENVTNLILPYIGPSMQADNKLLTPSYLNITGDIIIYLNNGDEIKIKNNEPILI